MSTNPSEPGSDSAQPKGDGSIDNSIGNVFSDAALLLAIATGLLYFLGAQREFSFVSHLNRGGAMKPMPDLEYLLIRGFAVICNFGGDSLWGFARYITRGIAFGIIAWTLSTNSEQKRAMHRSFSFWLACALVFWALSKSAYETGQADRARANRLYASAVVRPVDSGSLGGSAKHTDSDKSVMVRGRVSEVTPDGFLIRESSGLTQFVRKDQVNTISFEVVRDGAAPVLADHEFLAHLEPAWSPISRQPEGVRSPLTYWIRWLVCALAALITKILLNRRSRISSFITQNFAELVKRCSHSRRGGSHDTLWDGY